jgi:hypothetical protein
VLASIVAYYYFEGVTLVLRVMGILAGVGIGAALLYQAQARAGDMAVHSRVACGDPQGYLAYPSGDLADDDYGIHFSAATWSFLLESGFRAVDDHTRCYWPGSLSLCRSAGM